jgi:hypothetical protein
MLAFCSFLLAVNGRGPAGVPEARPEVVGHHGLTLPVSTARAYSSLVSVAVNDSMRLMIARLRWASEATLKLLLRLTCAVVENGAGVVYLSEIFASRALIDAVLTQFSSS